MIRCCFAVLLVIGLLAGALPASSQVLSEDDYHRNITVKQKRPFLEARRAELTATGAVSLSRSMFSHLGGGLQASWHLNEQLFLGLEYMHFMASETELKTEIEDVFEVVSDRSEMLYQATARFGWVPVIGKASVFGAFIGYFDAYLFAGGGITHTRLSDFAPTGRLGFGSRLFITQGLAVSIELSDSAYWETYLAGSGLVHNVMVTAGISVFLPYKTDDRFEK